MEESLGEADLELERGTEADQQRERRMEVTVFFFVRSSKIRGTFEGAYRGYK